MKKILIITYYWPPSGGAGVQRWVKLAKYLPDYGVKPIILTVDSASASYMQVDKKLMEDVDPNLIVHTTNSFEPINMYAKIVGKEKVPTAGFSNVNNSNWKQKLINRIRSNFFIPDPRRGWNKYACKKAIEIIENERIDTVITSSPPHSTQLIGLKLKTSHKLRWIADLRDPWTDIYYYGILGHSVLSKWIDKKYENTVVNSANDIITVSHSIKQLFGAKLKNGDHSKIHIVPNGFDHEDFQFEVEKNKEHFTLVYTGTMSNQYNPAVIFECVENLNQNFGSDLIRLQIVGSVSEDITQEIKNKLPNAEFVGHVSHNKVVRLQKSADMLLLVIPEVTNSEGILTGKLFEYLASGNPILGLGPVNGDAHQIVEECRLGKFFARKDKKEISKYLQEAVQNWKGNVHFTEQNERTKIYSRKYQAQQIAKIIEDQ